MKTKLLLLITSMVIPLSAQNTGDWSSDYTEDATPPPASVFTFQADPGDGLTQYWASWDDMTADILASPVVTGTLAVDTITDSTGGAGVSIESVTILAGDITTTGDLTVADLNADELLFAEVASVDDPTAGYGAFWVKSDSPTTPQFTDDTNVTVQLAPREIYTEVHAALDTLDAAQCYGGVHYVTDAVTITLPAVADGMSVTIIANVGNVVTVDPNASDLIIRDGTAQADGVTVTSTGTTGDIAVFTYYNATGWYCASNSWTQGS